MIRSSSLLRRAARAALALAVFGPAAAFTQQRDLTLDDLYDPEKKVDFEGNPPRGLVWIDDRHYLWPKTDPREHTTELLEVEAVTGRSEPLFDVAKVEAWIAGEEQKAIEIMSGDPVHPTPTNTRRPPHAEHAEEEAQEAPEGPEAAAERWLRTRRP